MRIVVAEDAALFREGLTRLLAECGHQVCAAVSDPGAVLQAVAEHRPDAVIMDVRMPPTHTDEGLRAALTLRRHYPGTGVLVLSQYIETRYTAQLLQGSASGVGYLLKERVADVDEFTDALARVASGGTALDPEVVSRLVSASHHSAGLAALTPRERDVLTLMAEGRSNAGIAAALVVSASVVEKHVARVFGKLNLPSSDADNRRVMAVLRYLSSLPGLWFSSGWARSPRKADQESRRSRSPVMTSSSSEVRVSRRCGEGRPSLRYMPPYPTAVPRPYAKVTNSALSRSGRRIHWDGPMPAPSMRQSGSSSRTNAEQASALRCTSDRRRAAMPPWCGSSLVSRIWLGTEVPASVRDFARTRASTMAGCRRIQPVRRPPQ
jgi:DNA-binding NarL/FixJ family response regulator